MAFRDIAQQGFAFDDDAPATRPVVRAQPPRPKLPELPDPPDWRPDEIPELRGEKRIILNCETNGLKWWAGDRPIGWAYKLPESGRQGYLPIRHMGGNLPVERVHDWLRDVRGMHVENQNMRFDLHMSREDGVDLIEGTGNTFGDPAHYEALLDDNRMRFNLDQLSKDRLGWDIFAPDDPLGPLPAGVRSEGEWWALHSSKVAPYALRNVEQVHQLIALDEPYIREENLGNVLALEQDIIPVVVEMERNGTYLDVDLLADWRVKATRDLEQALFLIKKLTGVSVSSPDSSKDWQAIFKNRGIPITSFTEHGAPSFAAGAVRHIDDEAVQAMRRAGDLAGLKSMFLDKYWDAMRASDGWLRFNLHQLRYGRDEGERVGTVSGRFSAAGDRHIKPDGLGSGGYNPQQVVAVEKQLERGWCPDYVVRKLFKLNFAADMMQVEYRLFADYANMHGAFRARPLQKIINGKPVWVQGPLADFHALVSELLLPVNPRLNRKLVKNINFAMIYGAGLVKFALMLGLITEAQYKEFTARLARKDWSVLNDPALAGATEIRNTYLEMFPAVKPLLDLASTTAKERGYVKDFLGRRARLLGRFHSALNRIIQGGAASYNKLVLVALYKLRKELGLTMRLTVHDEVCGDLADPKYLFAVRRVLNQQHWNFKVPILWDAKVGANWAACK